MNSSLVKNAADKKQVKRAKQTETFKRENEIEDMRVVLSSPHGRRVIWRYLELCGVFRYGFEDDPRFETFMAGKRDIGGRILADLTDVDPALFGDMCKEMKQEETND